MNLNSATVLDPVFHFLDGIIAEYGDYLFFAFVWLSVLVLAWVLSGGLRRKFPNQPHVRTAATNHHPRISPAGGWRGLNQRSRVVTKF